MSYTLPSLPYAYDALEPHFDKQTMEIHHTKHHQTYVNNANAALESLPEFANLPVEELITKLDQLPADKKTVLRNNAGGGGGDGYDQWRTLRFHHAAVRHKRRSWGICVDVVGVRAAHDDDYSGHCRDCLV